MSRIHVLQSGAVNVYTVVVHSATPVGNSPGGFPWTTLLVSSGEAKTVMTEGTGPGQITTAEKADVESGAVIEGVFQWEDNPLLTTGQRNAHLDLSAMQLIDEREALLTQSLRFYGYTRS